MQVGFLFIGYLRNQGTIKKQIIMADKSIKLKIYYSLKYLLFHEDYIDLSINQKINSKKLCFDFDRKK
jgi:hypothetical protein